MTDRLDDAAEARINGKLIDVQAARIKHLEALETAERAHADATAEASRGFLVSALRFYSASPTPSYDERFEGALGALREVLAAHDKRRRG